MACDIRFRCITGCGMCVVKWPQGVELTSITILSYGFLPWGGLLRSLLTAFKYAALFTVATMLCIHPQDLGLYHWEFVPFDPLRPSHPAYMPCLQQPPAYLWAQFFVDSTYEWGRMAFVFVWLTALSTGPSGPYTLLQLAGFLLFYSWVILDVCVCIHMYVCVYMCVCVPQFICSSTDGHFGCFCILDMVNSTVDI